MEQNSICYYQTPSNSEFGTVFFFVRSNFKPDLWNTSFIYLRVIDKFVLRKWKSLKIW